MKIYLAGGMGDLSFEESNAWRNYMVGKLPDFDYRDYEVNVINPNDYYNFVYKSHDSEKEVRNFDLRMVRDSDLIIVNFNDPKSIGTAQELAVAYELRIPVIGLNTNNEKLHPWLQECCERIFTDIDNLIEYVKDFYLS